jgi:large subunit ribosomal protein L29
MDVQDLRNKSESELRQELTGLLEEQFKLRMQKGVGQLARPHELRRVRKDIARVKTLLGEKTRQGDVA